ncbi:ankyrin [Gonapodya prolifera JEL478]|uniref:Ankyrin n=1 Tax=Gonapodya prolifera (strain JEL478) TaxID=1344416 RepID=A0A139ABY8_GONPJ|nr:ankyrin [Gonapodya prolifera JEL478]|eukprot:KXS13933.1 ankyrin [Gonapodya prolifera JEL478]
MPVLRLLVCGRPSHELDGAAILNNPTTRTSEPTCPLAVAAARGHTAVVLFLLDHGASVWVYEEEALMKAAAHGHADVVKLLLQRGADARVQNDKVLAVAAEGGSVEVMRLLLEDSISQDRRDALNAAIAAAAQWGRTEVVQYLLHFCTKTSITLNLDNALVLASRHGHTATVVLLLASGADAQTHHNEPLILSSWFGHTLVVQLLLAAGADPHVQNDKPLFKAAEWGHIATVRALLAAGADPTARDGELLIEAARWGHTPLVELLLTLELASPPTSPAANPTRARVHQHAALSAAVHGHADALRVLLTTCPSVDLSVASDVVHTALIRSARRGHVASTQLLLEHLGDAAPIHALNDAFVLAAEGGNEAIVAMLLDHGADVHARDDDALVKALEVVNEGMVRLLIRRGADVRTSGRALMKTAKRERRWALAEAMERAVNVHTRDIEVAEAFLQELSHELQHKAV